MAGHAIKAIVFDFFGVVCPDLAALTGAEFARRHSIDPAEFSAFGHVRRAGLDHGFMSGKQFARELVTEFHLAAPLDQIMAELDELDGKYHAFDPDLHALISCLKPKYSIALMSNVSRDEGAYLRSLGAFETFDHVFLSGEAGLTKSDPAWFDRVATALNCLPAECLLIDDIEANVVTARQAGWTQSLVYHNYRQLTRDLSL